MSATDRCDMAACIESATCEVLAKKSIRACLKRDAPRLVIAGGVAANTALRTLLAELAETNGIEVHMPHPRHCTDNAAMIAYAAFRKIMQGVSPPEEWDATPRWSLSNLS